MIGSSLGRYEVVAELGRGAMGVVYKARDPIIERHVAIKTLRGDFPAEERNAVRERFLREARSAGRLSHPSIVVIHDVGETDGMAYIAMEFLQGESLQSMLANNARLPLYTVAELAAQIADALDYAQRHEIVHRDVKPANIMVSPLGLAKLTDFGIAYVPSSSVTQTGTVLGSPKYMSPEQVMGEAIDGRSDIFSLGVVLYEMLTRRTPFERPSDTNIYGLMQRIVTDPHPRPSELDPAIPHGFDVILARALSKDASRRYQRASEFANDLRNFRSFAPSADATQVLQRSQAAERTAVLAPLSAPAAPPPPVAPPAPRREPAPAAQPTAETRALQQQLLADLDQFSDSLEDRQQRMVDEEAAGRRAESEERAKSFELHIDVPPAPESPEPWKTGADRPAASVAPRSGVLGMLRKKAEARVTAEAAPAVPAELVDTRMRAAFRYLNELVTEIKAARPACARRAEIIYIGSMPELAYVSAFVDYRTRAGSEAAHCERIIFNARLESPQPVRIDLVRDEIPRMKAELERLQFKYECKETKNDFGILMRGRFAIEPSLPVNAEFVADYRTGIVSAELRNVGVWGNAKFQIPVAELDDECLEELGKLLLGLQSRLGARLQLKQ